ncbi:GNAT family N-acetyltransferase, partial [Escherichia coli]
MKEKLISKTIYFRLADEHDAAFILNLRTDNAYNKYLSSTKFDLQEQKKWLSNYKKREKNKTEYYFIIHRLDNNQKIGTVRLYDFIEVKKSFCWGSWILNAGKTHSAALESALLVYHFAFVELGFEQSHFDVRKNNEKVIEFHKKMGAIEVSNNELDIFFKYTKD